MNKEIKLGYEIGTAKEVMVRYSHLIVTGITQLSGKTTTLEALIKRSGLKAVVFRTKIGEKTLTEGTETPPFFRDRSDYEFVKSLIEAYAKEKLFIEKGTLMRLCKGSASLIEIKRRVDEALAGGKLRGLKEEIHTRLQHYLENLIPQIQYANLSKTLTLYDGINIMNLERFSEEAQSLIIQSVADEVLKTMRDIVIIIPEAWKFLPQKYNNPCKRVVESFIRQGATNNNFIWIDSIPNYEAVLVKVDGKIRSTTMENLFDTLNGQIEKTPRNEEIKTIEQVQVLGSDSHRIKWIKVKRIIRHPYSGKVLTINTGNGVIDVSPNHPILKYPKYLVEASTIKLGDRLCTRKIEGTHLTNNYHGFFVGTKELAWLMGFYVAEGWIHKKHTFISNSNKEHIEKAKRAIWDNFHLLASYKTARKRVYTLDTNSPYMASFFKQFYVSERFNSRTKTVPESILNANINIKKAFLEGYLEGDGGFDKQRKLFRTITSVSRPLLLGILELMRATNFIKGLSVHIRDDKLDVVQFVLNKTENKRKKADEVKKIRERNYTGYLYDFEVDSHDHTFYLGIGNIRVHNSQDMAGVDKIPLKQIATWILGYQSERNEVKHTLDQISLPKKLKPKEDEIMNLKKGHFYLSSYDGVKRVYVQPSWLNNKDAIKIAMGDLSEEDVSSPDNLTPFSSAPNPKEENARMKIDNGETKRELIQLRIDFFDKIQELQIAIQKLYEELYKEGQKNINTDEIVSLVLQKIPVTHAQIDVDAVVSKVLGKIPKSGNVIYEVAPLEKLKKDFLENGKKIVLNEINTLSQKGKEMLKWVEANGKQTSRSEIVRKLWNYTTPSNQNNDFRLLEGKQMVRRDTAGRLYPNLKEFIKSYLANYEPTEQDIENLYNHILMEIK